MIKIVFRHNTILISESPGKRKWIFIPCFEENLLAVESLKRDGIWLQTNQGLTNKDH